MERGNVEVLLEEKLIELLKTSIAFDSRSNRNKTYSLLSEVSKNRSTEETNRLIELIDKQIRSFEVESIKNYFKDNSSKYTLFKDEINAFINSLDKKIPTNEDYNKKSDVKNEVIENEYDYFSSDSNIGLKDDYNKLTQEDIDGFMKKIDDKLAELEAEEQALDNKS